MKEGTYHSLETKQKMSLSRLGVIPWNKGTKGLMKAWNKGLSKETDERVRQYSEKVSLTKKGVPSTKKGKKSGIVTSGAFKKGHLPWNYIDGKSQSPNAGCGHPLGEAHWRWRGGEEAGVSNHWNTSEWRKIRLNILERDNDICQYCGETGCEVHHIIPYRFSKSDEEKNLITVCRPCHVEVENNIKNLQTGGI